MDSAKRCDCAAGCNGHAGRFSIADKPGYTEQLIFAGSHPAVAGTPVTHDRILAYVTVTNDGPRAVRVFWDGAPPAYKTPGRPAAPAPTDQFAVVLGGNSITVVVARAVKVVYAADADPSVVGDSSKGCYEVSWCCPPNWAAQPATGKPPDRPHPVPPAG